MTKKQFLISALSLIGVCGFCDTPSKHTADYIRGLAPDYLGKKVSLDVASVTPSHKADNKNFGFLVATTFDTRNRVAGGKMLIVADKDKSMDIAKRYGVKPDVERGRRGGFDIDTLRLYGVLRKTKSGMLFLDVASGEVPEDVLKGLKDDVGKIAVKGKGPIVVVPKGKPAIKKLPVKGKGKKK
jgi:hypothetical protein